MTIQLSIITPDQVFWTEPVEEMIIPTNTGQMGVLPSHADLITAVDIGVMSVLLKGKWVGIVLTNGFAAVRKNGVIVLVNSAETKDTIDREQADKDFGTTLETLQNAPDEKSRIEANLAFKRANARYVVSLDD